MHLGIQFPDVVEGRHTLQPGGHVVQLLKMIVFQLWNLDSLQTAILKDFEKVVTSMTF